MRGLVMPARVSGLPVQASAVWISSTEAVGLACLRIANAPATCGAAIEVPLMAA